MSLEKVGVNSLLAVNNWIAVINGNLNSASRTGYKTTRANFTDGLGVNTVSDGLTLPPSTLTVQSTRIEWGQGSVVNSDHRTHFALQGEGFFTLHDDQSGKYYLSRDGEFHWSHEGYLVNSSGLKVMSAGHDYIRYGEDDESDIFNIVGYSNDLQTYGDKSFMITDVANREGLRMSKYGSTVFELDGDIPLRLQNNFTTTADGLTFVYDDPSFDPIVDDPGFISPADAAALGIDSDFQIDFGNGVVFDWSTETGADFDFTTDTLQDVITELQTFAAAQGNVVPGVPRLTIAFDPADDLLVIENSVLPGQNNSVRFGGTNGGALADFFNIVDTGGAIQELETPTYKTQIITSREDIDNDHEAFFKDIGFPGQAGPIPYGSVPLNTTIADLVGRHTIAGNDDADLLTYTHDKVNGIVRSDTFLGPPVPGATVPPYGAYSGSAMIVGEAAPTDQFDIVFEGRVSNNGVLIFSFGKEDGNDFFSGGFSLEYNPVSGNVGLFQDPDGYEDDNVRPLVGGPINVGAVGTAATAGALGGGLNRFAVSLDENQSLTFSLNGNNATFDLGGAGQDLGGIISLRTAYRTGAPPGPADPPMSLEVNSLYADFKESINAGTAGEIVSLSQLGLDHVDRAVSGHPSTRVVQNALESSTASLTEYVPMLSLAQKVFSAVSKIISTYNQTVDDLNTLIR